MQDRVLEAIEPFKKAAKEDPKNSELLTNLAKAQHTAGLFREATVTYEQLIKLIGPKPEIKAAVELMFKVEVSGVSVVNTKGKTKRFGKSVGRRDNVRKAYVTLKAGQELNLSGEAA
ncbi:MAG: 50S ribosomal protein L23 [Burkholderiaceae bacterium]|nr:50S ribosomal protein L23 [Burkholderiaceae bacterium]